MLLQGRIDFNKKFKMIMKEKFFSDVVLEELYYINGGRAKVLRPGRDELHCIDDSGNVYIPPSGNKPESNREDKISTIYKDTTETHIKVSGNVSIDNLSYSGDISIDIKNEKVDVYVNNEHVFASK